MSITELKKRLISKIEESNNNGLLEEAYRLLEADVDESEILILSKEQKASIEKGRKQIDQGLFITDEEARQEIDEWLKK